MNEWELSGTNRSQKERFCSMAFLKSRSKNLLSMKFDFAGVQCRGFSSFISRDIWRDPNESFGSLHTCVERKLTPRNGESFGTLAESAECGPADAGTDPKKIMLSLDRPHMLVSDRLLNADKLHCYHEEYRPNHRRESFSPLGAGQIMSWNIRIAQRRRLSIHGLTYCQW